MKKIYTLLFIFSFTISYTNAQWVTIPDTNFVAFLQQNYPQCMNGNQMDTTCSVIVNETTVNCINKNIYDLTGIQYFDNLASLTCSWNYISSLPPLPYNLGFLDCQNNNLISIPLLPYNLGTLICNNNYISSMSSLPNSLQYFYCTNNNLSSLPNLPNSLIDLFCEQNQISFLPNLPNSIWDLRVGGNNLSSLPSLPLGLYILWCYDNNLSYLPALPTTLGALWCWNNNLTTLPTIPNNLSSINCSDNQLTSLPSLPPYLWELDVSNNQQLECLPLLGTINSLNFPNTGIGCLSNYGTVTTSYPPVASLPICDIFNGNSCDVFRNISGKIYSDSNSNCIDDAGEQSFSNLKLQLFQNGNLIQQVYSGNEGLYTFDTDTGTYTYTVDTTDLPVLVTCPSSGFHTSVLTPVDSMDYNMDFGMQCKPGFDIGVKNIVRHSGQFFPANLATIKIGAGDMANFYGLYCASGVNGSVIIDFTGPITYISEAPGALVPSVIGNTLTYSISDFGSVNFNSDFKFILQTDTNAQAGNSVCFTVNVTPTFGDNDVSNNSLQHCFTVVNSFDPNAKEVYPEGGLTPNQEWMTYTIHFQNTGNAPAQNIYILDTLDQNLIPSSFTLLSYSHEPLTQLFGNVVKFNFPNINLPDSTNDEPNSHGFVQYKVKMVQGLPVGTIISNTAYNYFDFNSPVATNTVSNMVGVTSVANNSENINISVFPNPATDEINISFTLISSSEIKIELYNSLGQVVKTISKNKYEAGKNLINFSVADIPDGVYHLRFSTNGNIVTKKIIKY